MRLCARGLERLDLGVARWGAGLPMTLGLLLIGLAVASAMVSSAEAQTPRRIALIVAIQDYDHLRDLFNPKNDAALMKRLFTAHGIAVTRLNNPTQGELLAGLSDFRAAARSADLAIIYYAGHGMNLAGADVLLPRDMPQRCGAVEAAALKGTVSLDQVLETLAEAKQRLVFLDACRSTAFPACPARGAARGDDPTAGRFRGLERKQAKGTLIVTSTARGELADDGPPGVNSPFATTLQSRFTAKPRAYFHDVMIDVATAMDTPGIGQQPDWYAPGGQPPLSCLAGEGCGEVAPPPADTGQAGLLGFIRGEWDRIKDSENPDVVKGFRAQFGKGNPYYDGLATDRLGVLERKAKERELALLQQRKEEAERKAREAEEARLRAEADRLVREAEERRKIEEDNRQKAAELGRNPGTEFQDCWTGSGGTSSVVVVAKGTPAEGAKGLARGQVCAPRMVVVPGGKFLMGSSPAEIAALTKEYGKEYEQYFEWEGPQREVTIGQPFAVGKFEVTFAEWDACVADKVCDDTGPRKEGGDENWGRETRPVINVSWKDAQTYIAWLNKKTGQTYRLLTETEWEYAARGGPEAKSGGTLRYWWGNEASHEYANYGKNECCSGLKQGKDQWENTAPVGQFSANPFGLHDLHGNVWEWVEDCWIDNYNKAPTDAQARTTGDCSSPVLRGGSWVGTPRILRSAVRSRYSPELRDINRGFRLARTITP